MTPFQERFLLCQDELSLIPGPETSAATPLFSFVQYDIAQYSANEVVNVISQLPSITIVDRGDQFDNQDWFRWSWHWQYQGGTVEIGFTVFDGLPVYWGGSVLRPNCTYLDIARLTCNVRDHLPRVWIQDANNIVYSPKTYLEAFALPRLHLALLDADEFTRNEAEVEMTTYRMFM